MQPPKKALSTNNHTLLWTKGDLHTHYGVLKEKDIKKAKHTLTSHLGTVFHVFPPSFPDLLKKAQRGPQIILTKDIGLILTETSLTKTSTVLEAGSGSGFLTCHLARFVKKVISYDQREDFLIIAKNNAALFNFKNITFKQKNVYEGIDEKGLDVIVLDLPEPERALQHSYDALAIGGYLVCYLPNITQVMGLVKNAQPLFHTLKITELLERPWHVEEQRVRPMSQMIGHTGFLCFFRKV